MVENIPSRAAGLIAERQLAEWAQVIVEPASSPAFGPGRTLRYQQDISQPRIRIKISRPPEGTIRRHCPASIGAEELAPSDDIGEAQPGDRFANGGVGALVFLLRSRRGQVGAQLITESLGLWVDDLQLQLPQTSAAAAVESGRTGAFSRLGACGRGACGKMGTYEWKSECE